MSGSIKKEFIMGSPRIAIKKLLEKEFTVYHVGILDDSAILTLPFLILEMTGEHRTMRSHFVTFSIYIYAPIKAPFILDECERKVKKLLIKKRIKTKESSFIVESLGSSGEFINEKLRALGKIIEFKIPLV